MYFAMFTSPWSQERSGAGGIDIATSHSLALFLIGRRARHRPGL
jgi:hypothetical protein